MKRGSPCGQATGFAFASPHAAVAALIDQIDSVSTERVPLSHASGRVLAQAVVADRDSPPADVSAMDGFAVRLCDLTPGARLPVADTVAIGQAPPSLPPGAAVRIPTGACTPEQAEAVIPRELVDETADAIVLPAQGLAIQAGRHIRRRGENRRAGEAVVESGQAVDANTVAAIAGFGIATPRVYRKLRVTVLTTGDELLPVDSRPSEWQIRNSNGPAIENWLATKPWVGEAQARHVTDSADGIAQALQAALAESDAVITTGGVSMGDRDYLPSSIAAIGGSVVYHKLPMRPGKPNLGALSADGKPILALPGNPVAVLVALHVLASPVLRKLVGFDRPQPPHARVVLDTPADRALPLWWYRPVRLIEDGVAQLVANMGSGDFASAANADGFIQTPPNETGKGAWVFYPSNT